MFSKQMIQKDSKVKLKKKKKGWKERKTFSEQQNKTIKQKKLVKRNINEERKEERTAKIKKERITKK